MCYEFTQFSVNHFTVLEITATLPDTHANAAHSCLPSLFHASQWLPGDSKQPHIKYEVLTKGALGLGMWLSRESACLAHKKPWDQ